MKLRAILQELGPRDQYNDIRHAYSKKRIGDVRSEIDSIDAVIKHFEELCEKLPKLNRLPKLNCALYSNTLENLKKDKARLEADLKDGNV